MGGGDPGRDGMGEGWRINGSGDEAKEKKSQKFFGWRIRCQ